MPDQDVRALLLTIQANTELLRSNLSAAERAVEEFTTKTQSHLDRQDERFELFGKGLEKLEGPLERLNQLTETAVGALLGESLVEAGKKALEFAGNVQFVSEQVGTSTDFLQKYRFAASQFGVSTSEADEGLGKFARSIGEAANGNRSLIDLFDRLGVKVRDNSGAVRSVESVYLDTASAIAKLPDPAEKAADVLSLMGKNAVSLVPLLSQGASGFNTLASAAEQLGIVLSSELIEHSEEVNHKMAALKAILDAEMASAIAQNAGAIEGLANAMVTAAGAFARFLNVNPQAALALLGAGAGFLKGGAVGAIVGAGAGFVGGEALAQSRADDTGDLREREEAFRAASARLHRDQHAGGSGSIFSITTADTVSDRGDLPAAQREFARQRALYVAALRQAHAPHESELGSDGAGATNDNGGDLAAAQKRLAALEQQRTHASGAALTAINQEIVEQKRRIGFIRQGADTELANSLAAKTGGVEDRAAHDARREADKAAAIAAEEQRKADAQTLAYVEEELKLRKAILEGAKAGVVTDAQRDQLQRDIVNADAQAEAARIAGARQQVYDDPHSTPEQRAAADTRAAELARLNEQNRQQGITNVGIDRAAQTQREAADKAALELHGQSEMTELADRLALTRKERLGYELELLRYSEQLAKAEQQAIIDSTDPKVTQAQRDEARTRIGQIDAAHPRNVALVERQNESPLASYRDQLQTSVGDVNDALQGVEVDGLRGLDDGLQGIVTGTETVSSAFKKMATSIIADLARIAIEKEIIQPLTGFLGFKDGGEIAKFADGGLLGGRGGPRDDANIVRVSPGEFIVNAEATRRHFPLIRAINDGSLRRFATGGLIAPVATIPRAPSLSSLGAARQRAMAGGGSLVKVEIDKSELFDTHVRVAAAPQAQAAVVGGARMAQREIAEEQHGTIPL